MPRLRHATREIRRLEFVEAAWRCAARQGFRDMTLEEVCRDAGYTKGSFYAHFDSKEALLEALIEDEAAAVDAAIVDLERASTLPLKERLHRLMQILVERGSDPARMQVRADLWSAILTQPVIGKALARAVQRQRWILRNWIDSAVKEGQIKPVPANALASVLLALHDGLVLHLALDPAAFRWANVSKAVDALLEGIHA